MKDSLTWENVACDMTSRWREARSDGLIVMETSGVPRAVAPVLMQLKFRDSAQERFVTISALNPCKIGKQPCKDFFERGAKF